MKMPNNEQAKIAEKKITRYLLSYSHEIGKDKAKFFKRFGFDATEELFKKSPAWHAIERDVEENTFTGYGDKYELKCEIKTPDDRNPCVVTVWIIETGRRNPILITAYPSK